VNPARKYFVRCYDNDVLSVLCKTNVIFMYFHANLNFPLSKKSHILLGRELSRFGKWAYFPFLFSLTLQPPWTLTSAFQFHDHFTDGRTPWTSDQLVARPLPKHKHRINTHTHQTSMPWVGFESTIPASERAKRAHDLNRSATVTGVFSIRVNLLRSKSRLGLLKTYLFCGMPSISKVTVSYWK
jgi:hypothetical protein